MFRNQYRLLGYLLPLALAMLCLIPFEASAQRRASDRETFVNAPPTLILSSDSPVITTCNTGSSQVRLHARAQSPGGNPIRYRWSTSTGRIVGDGETVTWDLSGVGPGYYKASLEIGTGSADGECQAFASTNVLINSCPAPVPVCPNVSVVCPTNVAIDQPISFTSNVTGGSATGNAPLYTWTVSAGRIIEGQGTPTIKVDTTGLAGQSIRASLAIGGYPQECFDSCEVNIPLPQATCRKFDEFPEISRNDVKARLDNFVVQLQNDPTSTGYVIVYPGPTGKPGEAQRKAASLVDYLVNSRGLDARRVVTLIGGAGRDEMMYQLWVCPRGGTPPTP
jgi:hypothetical protein